MRKKFYVSQIKESYTRQNFETLGQVFMANPFLKGDWDFRTFTFSTAQTNYKVEHNLGYQPTDVILLSAIGGTIVFNYNLFDKTFLNVTTTLTVSTVPLVVRLFVGRYTEDTINV